MHATGPIAYKSVGKWCSDNTVCDHGCCNSYGSCPQCKREPVLLPQPIYDLPPAPSAPRVSSLPRGLVRTSRPSLVSSPSSRSHDSSRNPSPAPKPVASAPSTVRGSASQKNLSVSKNGSIITGIPSQPDSVSSTVTSQSDQNIPKGTLSSTTESELDTPRSFVTLPCGCNICPTHSSRSLTASSKIEEAASSLPKECPRTFSPASSTSTLESWTSALENQPDSDSTPHTNDPTRADGELHLLPEAIPRSNTTGIAALSTGFSPSVSDSGPGSETGSNNGQEESRLRDRVGRRLRFTGGLLGGVLRPKSQRS